MLDENEFLSPYGIRSLSRYHAEHPYVFRAGGQEYRVAYLPAESDTGMFGGNSNWRGPIWMPVNALIIRALLQYYTLLRRRLHRRVPDRLRPADEPVRGGRGDRPPAGAASSCATSRAGGRSTAATRKFQDDPHWRDYLLFYEYFHGDNGAGLGASHQTGWTGVVARAHAPVRDDHAAEQVLEMGKSRDFDAQRSRRRGRVARTPRPTRCRLRLASDIRRSTRSTRGSG